MTLSSHSAQPTADDETAEMAWIPGGTFRMGSDNHYPEEGPAHDVRVDGFWIDRHPVTNAEFARFIKTTGYVTVAEHPPRADDYPDALPELLVPGSAVFRQPPGPVNMRDCTAWWAYVPGACWHHPQGAGSTWQGLEHHPVVHIAYADAEAYACWAGKQLPSEAQWERAARGGLEGAEYCWGNELAPGGQVMANTWQGQFPWENLATDGFERTSPVGTFPANAFGLHDMAGNVWQWTADWYFPGHEIKSGHSCCAPLNPKGPPRDLSFDPGMPQSPLACKVLKGGSFLCSPNYCLRYRPAARFPQTPDTSTCHIGFRCVRLGEEGRSP